ncbi:MAG TPA: LuxR C-terminal-related transcriptional regulator [Candidatus Kapabacteria bacterium]|jgi:DNA-binding CsgD family transcriptional regulator|nr:LuxR C-terminal-related transcriptional regulator [Candidatus Kapabacteria bacterium]
MVERLATIYKRWGKYTDPEKWAAIEDAQAYILEHPADVEVRLVCGLLQVRGYIKGGDLHAALALLDDTESAFALHPLAGWIPELQRLRAMVFQMQGRRPEAFELLIKAYTSAEVEASHATLAQISLHLGIIAANSGDYDGASVYLQRSLEHSELDDVDLSQVAQAHLVLAQAQLERGAHEEAQHHAERSYSAYSEIGNADSSNAATLLVSIHLDRKDLKAAREVLTSISSQKVTPFQEISMLNLNAKLCSLEDRFQEAIGYHDSAIKLATKSGNNRLKVNSVQLKVETLLSASEFEEAFELLGTIMPEVSEGYDTLSLHELLGRALEGLGRYRDALEEQKKFSTLQKQLLSERASNALSRLRAAQEVLQAERDAAHFRERSQFYANELSQRTSYLVQQNEYINNVIDHIQSLASQRPDALELLKDIRKRLRQLPAASFDWNEYLRLFDEIHPNALAILKEEYPALTETESRVCSLVLAKLSNIEIGRLLSITERTVENHRHRLRKKLGLQVNTDLAVFLEQTVAEKKSKSAPRQAIK